MSVKKVITLKKGISGEFVCRIERVSVCNKPDQIATATATAVWYADNDEKTALRPLVEPMSFDFPVSGFVSTENAIERAYTELKQPGRMLENGTDC